MAVLPSGALAQRGQRAVRGLTDLVGEEGIVGAARRQQTLRGPEDVDDVDVVAHTFADRPDVDTDAHGPDPVQHGVELELQHFGGGASGRCPSVTSHGIEGRSHSAGG